MHAVVPKGCLPCMQNWSGFSARSWYCESGVGPSKTLQRTGEQGPGAKHKVEILSETFGLMVRSCIKACLGLLVLMGPEAIGDLFKMGQPKLESCDRSSIVASGCNCENRTTPERSAL